MIKVLPDFGTLFRFVCRTDPNNPSAVDAGIGYINTTSHAVETPWAANGVGPSTFSPGDWADIGGGTFDALSTTDGVHAAILSTLITTGDGKCNATIQVIEQSAT